jgi:hypothetical protein
VGGKPGEDTADEAIAPAAPEFTKSEMRDIPFTLSLALSQYKPMPRKYVRRYLPFAVSAFQAACESM